MNDTKTKCDIGLVGLAVMGENLVLNMANNGFKVAVFNRATSKVDGCTEGRAVLPANLLQAQRDYFGAHTYERIDKPRGEYFHTNWTGTGGDTVSTAYNV